MPKVPFRRTVGCCKRKKKNSIAPEFIPVLDEISLAPEFIPVLNEISLAPE
jgi:hypothetical protein